MPKKTETFDPVEPVEPVADNSVEIRRPGGKIEKVAPAAADILCRKGGCVNVAKEKAELAAKEAAEEAAKKQAEEAGEKD